MKRPTLPAAAVGLLITLLLATIGCGGSSPDESASKQGESLVGGVPTSDFPAVGQLFWTIRPLCTATLVASHVIITAAHCFNYASAWAVGSGYAFRIQDGRVYPVRRYISLGNSPGGQDIAMAQLESDVGFVPPIPISDHAPPIGTPITVLGYGCYDRLTFAGAYDLVKRELVSSWTGFGLLTANLCPGDSGGPGLWFGGVLSISSFAWLSPTGASSAYDGYAYPFVPSNRTWVDYVLWVYEAEPVESAR
jgi:hypothetical protein